MQELTVEQLPAVRGLFQPERPGAQILGQHLTSGVGRCWADRLPEPRVALVDVAANWALRGDPAILDAAAAADLAAMLSTVAGFVEAGPQWERALRLAAPDLAVWDRVVEVLPDHVAVPPTALPVRRLTAADAAAIAALPSTIGWIANTWGGADALARSEFAFGAFVDGQLASVATTFTVGDRFEDLGVVTRAEYRRRGLSTGCATAVIGDVRSRGHTPNWTTSPDNTASLAVAHRLGFRRERTDVLWMLRTPVPTADE